MPKPAVSRLTAVLTALSFLAVAGAVQSTAQKNVVQPGDPIIASSANSPGSEGVANAIDGTQAKYLNRDSATPSKPAGFVVTPSVGVTWVTGLAMQSANDAPERDPLSVTLEGSNDDTIADFNSGTWELIYKNEAVPVYTARFETKTFSFDNFKPYKHYRWTILKTATDNSCCMQIAEVQLLGTTLPKNVVQPGDPIIASSANSPGSEGVANAIDGTQAKYLNRDSAAPAKPAGFVVTPSVGATLINGLSMQSANDAPERDPLSVTLEGSNDDTIADFNSGTWALVYKNEAVPTFATRFQTLTFLFDNVKPYKHYRWTVLKTATDNSCCMQIAEVQLLGSGAPKNVIQPGDPIIASSANSPGSEGVANAIDGTQAKYLNRDSAAPSKPAGFVVTPSVGETTIIGLSMQSANDAPERDPLSVTVEGSNDETIADFNSGTWELVYKNEAVPTYATRFETQTFYFNNKKSYKHYRWTVLKTATDNSCCMQIAEVGLLAVTSSVDCSKTAFVLQPIDTPALEGTPATFFTIVNGPWPVQWSVNGKAIPGATKLSYTTPPVTAAIATNVYTVEIVGCQVSTPVHASIFKPAPPTSIGVQFWGGGANGAGPQGGENYLKPADIVGVQPQAYWNVATNGSGITGDETTLPSVMTDSDGKPSAVTFEFTTSGTWGAGTGLDTPTQRMLNGIAGIGGTGTDQTMTFHNVPAGKHSLLVYAVAAPLNFQTLSYAVGTQKYYIRVMNSDEYKPAPGFYRGTSTDSKNPSIANFIRFDNVSPDASGDVTLTFAVVATGGQANNTGVNALQLVLNAPAVGAPPSITVDPKPTVGAADGTVHLSVQATGENLTYQWRKNGKNLPDGGHVSGATTSTLTISSLSDADVAVYNAAVFNPAGSVVSKNATVNISKFDIKDALVGYWKLDETSGAKAANAVTGGQAGDVVGTAAWGKGQIANGLTFDGASTYVVVPNYPKATKALSVSGWVNVSAGTASSVALVRSAHGNLGISVAQDGAPASQFELVLNANDTGALFLHAGITAGPNHTTVDSPTAFTLGSWQHVAFTADGAQLRLYVNGVEVANTPYLADFIVPEVQDLSFGARLNVDAEQTPPLLGLDATPNLLGGNLDDIAIWNRSLTADEVSGVFTAGKAGKDVTTVVVTPPAEGDGTYKIGLNFGADQPNSSLAATDKAGADDAAQTNWNNLSGQNGTNTTLVALSDGLTPESTTVKVVWTSNNTWASTGIGEENNSLTGADKTLMTGYLDTTDNSTTKVAISELPAALTSESYDVYVYVLGGVANKGGGYRIVDAAGNVLKGYLRAQPPAKPTSFVEVPSADPTSTNNIGTYIVFTGLSSPAIQIEATTSGGQGFGSTAFRAPINAIQLVSPSSAPAGPPISVAKGTANNLVITYQGVLQSADQVGGPYTNVQGATSPFTATATGSVKFFRAVKQ